MRVRLQYSGTNFRLPRVAPETNPRSKTITQAPQSGRGRITANVNNNRITARVNKSSDQLGRLADQAAPQA
jgi:hypothetical protein